MAQESSSPGWNALRANDTQRLREIREKLKKLERELQALARASPCRGATLTAHALRDPAAPVHGLTGRRSSTVRSGQRPASWRATSGSRRPRWSQLTIRHPA